MPLRALFGLVRPKDWEQICPSRERWYKKWRSRAGVGSAASPDHSPILPRFPIHEITLLPLHRVAEQFHIGKPASACLKSLRWEIVAQLLWSKRPGHGLIVCL
jgi:hypothetical protein